MAQAIAPGSNSAATGGVFSADSSGAPFAAESEKPVKILKQPENP
jgi:hypothetical protein